MHLPYDPSEGQIFWQAISRLPGYPVGEHMPIQMMLFESGALFRLGEVLQHIGARPAFPVLVIMDQTPMQRGHESLKPLVLKVLRQAGWQVEPFEIAPDSTGQVHTDVPHIEQVKSLLRPGISVVALGSGTICDITKHACHLYNSQTGEQIPFLVFQTANSVSAFTSNMAPTFIEGVKRTLASRYPDALVCDLETLRDAPREMTVSGVGDLLAAFVSFPDWLLANRLGLDPSYSQLAQRLMGPLDEIFLDQAEAIRSGSLDGMAVLAKLISLGGLAMSLSHATTPMSGYEHVMSHILDLLAEQAGRPLAQHGSQVSLASILGTGAYQYFLGEFEPQAVKVAHCYPSEDGMKSKIMESFNTIDPSGNAGRECWSDYRQKLEAWNAHRSDFQTFLQDWPEILPQLRRLTCPPQRLIAILRLIDAPLTFDQLLPPAENNDVKFAFMNAPLMRKRLTLGDLLIFLNWDRESLWSKISRQVF